jgi:hypothetical protein
MPSKLDIRAGIRHDSGDAVMRDAVLRGAGLTRRRVVRS